LSCLRGTLEVAAQATTDKSSLKAQVDNLAAKNSSLKIKADGLAAEAAQLRDDRTNAQDLFDKCQADVESKEKNLQQCLQTALDSLHGKFIPCLN
jgi:chromosome segregation ATPase